MKNERLLEAYESFCRLMVEERLYLNPTLTYETVCRWLGVGEKELDAQLSRELGYTGPALIQHFRKQTNYRLCDTYGINLYGGQTE